MLKLFAYFNTQERRSCWFILLLILIQVWLDLKLPDYMASITTLVETPGSTLTAILQQGGWMLLCAFGSTLTFLLVSYLSARTAAGLSRTLRHSVYDRTLNFSQAEMQKFSAASLINRTTNDITQIQTLVTIGLQAILKAPFLAIWAMIKISDKEWQWSAGTAAAVFLLILLLSTVLIFVVPRFRRIQTLTDTLNRIVREQLQGIRVVRAYNASAYQEKKFAQANADLTQNNLVTARIMGLLPPAMIFISIGLTLFVYWIGAYIIAAAAMDDRLRIFSDMVVFSNYAMQVILAFMLLNLVFILVPRAQVSAQRILEVLDTQPSITDGSRTLADRTQPGTLEFRAVTFRYHASAEPVLKDISFQAKRGETLAIIGATGSGKTTLVQLLLRTYDASEGSVLVDGLNVRDYQRAALQKLIGYVPQQAQLFAGTIAENIAYGGRDTAPDAAAIDEAARLACCTEFIASLPEGFQAHVAQGGQNFSGGQRQRLTIARAIAWQPEIFIFDDSFSALDYQTDRQLRKLLADELRDTIKIIVAQRIGTIRHADRILVLEHGRIVGQGTHDELLRSCSVYQEIARSQLSEEEMNYA